MTSETRRHTGRPTRFDDGTMAILAQLHPEVRSKRGLVDIAYRQLAIAILKDIPACRWLCDIDGMRRGDDSAWQPGILTELGRIDDVETLVALAIEVCERQPSRKDAIDLIRRYRGATRPPLPDQLTTELLGVINDYIRRYPQTAWPTVHDALALVQVAVRGAQHDAAEPTPIREEQGTI